MSVDTAHATGQTVLLYYKYVSLREGRDVIVDWMRSNCEGLGLKGRVRVAYDGINVTV